MQLLRQFLAGIGFDVLHDLAQDLLLHFLCVVWREVKGYNQFLSEISR